MFHFYITSAYIIPNIYIFFRIKDLFISKGYRLLFTLVFLITAMLFPLTQLFSHSDTNTVMQVLSSISGYILPFFLYLFLFVLLYDLLLLFNLMFRIVPSETRKKISFRLYALSSIILLSVLVVAGGAINMNTIRISKYKADVPRRHSCAEHLRVAFVSDFHIQRNTSLVFVEQFVQKMKALQPDIILYGGDMVEGDKENETTGAIESAIKNIHSKYGSFGVTGNHEFYGGNNQGIFFRKAGIRLLCDTLIRIDDAFYLAGRYDQHIRKRKPVNEIVDGASNDLPVILMDHRPTELQEVSCTAADIQFSGHTHNGQMFPINLITQSMYELSWGYKKIRNTHFFVSSGLRLWGPPVRTTGKSEIILVDIDFK
jgi:predicted MPP superfamily phosphohydrolase